MEENKYICSGCNYLYPETWEDGELLEHEGKFYCSECYANIERDIIEDESFLSEEY